MNICFNEAQRDLDQIRSDAKSFSDQATSSRLFDVQFLDVASESVLSKARELNLLSETTYSTIGLLQRDETSRFITKSVDDSEHRTNIVVSSSSDKVYLWPNQNLYFMNRFLIRWNLSDNQCKEAGCGNCLVSAATSMEVRLIGEFEGLYYSTISSSDKALRSLMLIPYAARKSLLILVDHCGYLLSVPVCQMAIVFICEI